MSIQVDVIEKYCRGTKMCPQYSILFYSRLFIIMDTFLITRGYVVIYEPFTDIIHINLLPNMENMYGRRD